MIRIFVMFAIIFSSIGCNACRRLQHCTTESCAPSESYSTSSAPQAAPQSAPAPAPAAPQAAPAPAAAAPQAFVQPQQGMMMMPQQGMMMPSYGQSQMLMPAGFMQPAPQFNMQGATMTSTQGRTRLAFSLSTIKIPMPWIKATPVQGPQEITMHVPAPQMQQQMQPQMYFQGQQMMQPQMMMPTPYMMGQGQMMPGMQGMQGPFLGSPQGFAGNFAQSAPQANIVCPPCPPNTNTGVTPERVQKLTAQILELEQQMKTASPAAAAAKETPKDGK